MKDPNTVEVDEKVSQRSFFKICLEKGSIPVDTAKLGVPLSRGDVNEAGLDNVSASQRKDGVENSHCLKEQSWQDLRDTRRVD